VVITTDLMLLDSVNEEQPVRILAKAHSFASRMPILFIVSRLICGLASGVSGTRQLDLLIR